MKKCLIFLFVLMGLAGGTACHAQNATVSYTYDVCGNRISRTLGFKKAEESGRPFDNDNKGWQASATDTLVGISFSLYPNPTDGQFSLAFSEAVPSPVRAVLCAVGGAVIESRTLTGLSEAFDLTDKPAGIYLLHLSAGNETQTWKIIKKN